MMNPRARSTGKVHSDGIIRATGPSPIRAKLSLWYQCIPAALWSPEHTIGKKKRYSNCAYGARWRESGALLKRKVFQLSDSAVPPFAGFPAHADHHISAHTEAVTLMCGRAKSYYLPGKHAWPPELSRVAGGCRPTSRLCGLMTPAFMDTPSHKPAGRVKVPRVITRPSAQYAGVHAGDERAADCACAQPNRLPFACHGAIVPSSLHEARLWPTRLQILRETRQDGQANLSPRLHLRFPDHRNVFNHRAYHRADGLDRCVPLPCS